jgi:hypothetical protein
LLACETYETVSRSSFFLTVLPLEIPTAIDGERVGRWIGEALGSGGPSPFVKGQIPDVFEAYLRIFHPVRDRDGTATSWAEVAHKMGRTAHRQMQWHSIVGAREAHSLVGSSWPGTRPALGQLQPQPLRVLCEGLAYHTREPATCFFGLSTIFGGVEELAADKPLLRFSHREFVILSGPLSAVVNVGIPPSPASFSAGLGVGMNSSMARHGPHDLMLQSPNLMWPADRAWYVASEFDFDSTLVGGSEGLIDELMADPRLETMVVHPEDSLAADADKINSSDDEVV